jgi:hypothetical protein
VTGGDDDPAERDERGRRGGFSLYPLSAPRSSCLYYYLALTGGESSDDG